MANKHQVLDLLNKGRNDTEIAEKLDCIREYVTATRRRLIKRGEFRASDYAYRNANPRRLDQR